MLDGVGFTGINVSVVGIQKVVEDAYSFARGLIYGSPVVEEFLLRGVDVHSVVDALTEILLREFGSQPIRMPLRAIVFDARRP